MVIWFGFIYLCGEFMLGWYYGFGIEVYWSVKRCIGVSGGKVMGK